MSTKNIEAVLLWAAQGDAPAELAEAMNEVGAIRRAAKTLDRLHVGDFTYNIRDKAASDTSFTGNTWEHPDTKAWSDASVLMGAIAKEEP